MKKEKNIKAECLKLLKTGLSKQYPYAVYFGGFLMTSDVYRVISIPIKDEAMKQLFNLTVEGCYAIDIQCESLYLVENAEEELKFAFEPAKVLEGKKASVKMMCYTNLDFLTFFKEAKVFVNEKLFRKTLGLLFNSGTIFYDVSEFLVGMTRICEVIDTYCVFMPAKINIDEIERGEFDLFDDFG